MKQTNNAIKFLMAQYRAIFKKAYLSGVASAVVLTAGLAAGASAQAATISESDLSQWEANLKDSTTGEGKEFDVDATNNKLKIKIKAVESQVDLAKTGGTLNIEAGDFLNSASSGTYIQNASNKSLNLKDDKFTINVNTQDAAQGLMLSTMTDSSSGSLNVDVKAINVTKGTLALAVGAGARGSGTVTVTANEITVGGTSADATDQGTISLGVAPNKYYAAPTGDGTITLGNAADYTGNNKITASVTTLKEGGVIKFGGDSSSANVSKVVYEGQHQGRGGLLDFSSGSGTVKSYSWHEDILGTSVKDDGKTALTADELAAIGTHTNMIIGANNTAVFDGPAIDDDRLDTTQAQKTTRSVFKFGPNSEILFSGDGAKSGGVFSISGASIVEIDNDATLSVRNDPTTNPVSHIKISGSGSNSYQKAELRIGGDSLVSFLTADDVQLAITDDASATTDNAGAILLSDNGILKINDDRVVELSATKVSSDTDTINLVINSGGQIMASSGGQIMVSGGGLIKANNISFATKVSGGDSTNLAVDANNLTLGSAGHTRANKFGFSGGATVHNSLTFVNSIGEDSVALQESIILNRYYYKQQSASLDSSGKFITDNSRHDDILHLNTSEVQKAGEINGNVELSGAGSLSITGGSWNGNGDITITSGTLTISAPDTASQNANSNYYNNSNPTYVKLKGALSFSGAQTEYSKLNVTGSKSNNATLDLTDATINWTDGSSSGGTITLSGSTISLNNFVDKDAAEKLFADTFLDQVGWGTLLIDHQDFMSFISPTTNAKSEMIISGGGVLHVANQTSSHQINIDRFKSGTGAASVIHFSGADSHFVIDGYLNLFANSSSTNDKALNIGEGNIHADSISFDTYENVTGNGNLPASSDKLKDTGSVIQDGNLFVTEGFSTKNYLLTIGNNSSTSGSSLNLDAGVGNIGTLSIANGPDAKKQATIDIGGTNDHAGSLNIETGIWNANNTDIKVSTDGARLEVGSEEQDLIEEARYQSSLKGQPQYIAQFTGDNFSSSTSSQSVHLLEINQFSKATFNSMQVKGGLLDVNGHLLITGVDGSAVATDDAVLKNYTKTNGVSIGSGTTINVTGAGAIFEFGELATKGLISGLDTIDLTKKNISFTNNGIHKDANWNVSDFGQIKLNFTESQKLSNEDLKFLIGNDGFNIKNNSNGYINLVGTNLFEGDFKSYGEGTYTIAWDAIEDFTQVVGGKITTDKLINSLVTGIDNNDRVKGHFGALHVNDNVLTNNGGLLTLNGSTSLQNAAAFGGNFISTGTIGTDGKFTPGTVVGVQLTNGASLSLQNGGVIGAIQGASNYAGNDDASFDHNGNVNYKVGQNDVLITSTNDSLTDIRGSVTKINDFMVHSKTQVLGEVSANSLELKSDLNVLAADQGNSKVTVDEADLHEGSFLKADVVTFGRTNNHLGHMDETSIMGKAEINHLNVAHSDVMILNGEVKVAGNLTLDDKLNPGKSNINVGYEPGSRNTTDDLGTIYDDTKSYTGYLEVKGDTTLNGGLLAVDPEYNLPTAYIALDDLSGAASDSNKTLQAGTLDGNVYIGANSVLSIGAGGLAEAKELVAKYNGGNVSLNPDEFGSALVLGKSFKIAEGKGLTLTAKKYEEFVKYYNDNNGTQPDIPIDADGDSFPVIDNTVYLGGDTAIFVTNEAMSKATTTPLISFATTQTGGGNVIADGGEIVVDGNVRATTYNVFENASIKYINGDAYRPVGANGEITINEDKDIRVSTENNFLVGYVENNGTVALGINPNGRAIMSRASNPVYEALESYAKGYVGDSLAADGSNALKGYDNKDHLVAGYHNNDFLQQTISTGDGAAAETVARLGVYGGAAQVALAAGNTTSEAISGRMGMGMNTALTQANNGQGAGMWVSPIYRSHSSDSLGAQGVNYGVDVNVYGVALGGDFTMANGLRVGAMFNVGSGDADGQDAGASVSNDFDYYGFGAYVGYTYDKFTVLGDISYTVADNDVTGSTSIENVKTSFDSSNLSFGVTGQYNLTLGNDVSVMPHAGLRFSKIDLDNYTVKGSNDVAHFSAESLNVFSVPVGVTFSKEYIGESWTVKPSLDITLTGNFGDDSLDGDVNWSGVYNYETATSTEVLDSFTYGATAGFSATTGSFTMGIGVSYTGSSNSDEFGLNANARFLF